MIMNMTGGEGGAALNYTVVGGTTQPTTPTENMIWVNTDSEITSHVFSTTEPTSPVAGMVWFNTGTSSNAAFNALKKNTITVYPTGCKQYVSGAWVDKTAKTYQGGAWVDWEFILYDNGISGVTFATSLTGAATATETDGAWVLFSGKTSSASRAMLHTEEQIDLTKYNKVLLNYTVTEKGGSVTALLAVRSALSGGIVASLSIDSAVGTYDVELDISDVNQSLYIAVSNGNGGNGSSRYMTMKVHKLRLM